jgi:N-acetyl-gamma-glutamyl-phosphate reductase
MTTPSSVSVAILGASGFGGGELVRLLSAHPETEIAFLGARGSAGERLGAVHPHLAGLPEADLVLGSMDPATIAERAQIVFSALPHGSAAEVAPALLQRGATVIDLSGDFRLPVGAYPEWYGFEHPAPEWLDKAVYGLPELFADQIAGASLVANPGCFATAAILGLAPLVRAGVVDPTGAVRIDGKSGLSGAGKGATEANTFHASEESIRPYRVPRHQHTPEIERGLELATGAPARVLFVPHLVPAVRGVVTTTYVEMDEAITTEDLTGRLAAAYAGQPFVRVLPPGAMVDSKRVRGSNVIELQAVADPRTGTAIVVAAVDNLVKGAAGQAIQNMNLVLGLEGSTGLPLAGLSP